MNKLKGLALGTALAAVLAAGGLLVASVAFAATGTVEVESGSAVVGEDGVVDVNALDVTEPGLGAWTVDIFYDPDVVTATACSAAQGGVCNAEFADDTVRVTGAVAVGLEGDSLLGNITFECGDEAGESPLEVSLFTFADGTLGGPLDIDAETVDGTFACTEVEPTQQPSLPPSGTGTTGSGNAMTWLIVALAVAGLTGIAGYGALSAYVRRS